MPKAVERMAEDMEEATEVVAEGVMGDTLRVTAMVITEEPGMVGGVIPIDGVILIDGATHIDGVIRTGGPILIGGAIHTVGTTLTTPTMIPTTILITMKVMEGRRRLHRGGLLRRYRDNSNFLTGASVRIQRVTTPILKIARGAG